jgi:hypothetical protein
MCFRALLQLDRTRTSAGICGWVGKLREPSSLVTPLRLSSSGISYHDREIFLGVLARPESHYSNCSTARTRPR